MARPSKPSAIKELTGNPGKRRLNKSEPRPYGEPARPTIMTPAARKVWAKLVVSMPPGVYTFADSHMMAAYCEAVAAHQRATKHIIDGAGEVTGSTGQTKLSPWLKEQADSARLIVTIGAKLGLDPVSRQHIQTDKGGPSDEDNDGLLN
jgi:P27 family predicted phage terminase small subunit